MTPLHLEILLWYFSHGDDFEMIESNGTRKEFAQQLVGAGMLEPNPLAPPPGGGGTPTCSAARQEAKRGSNTSFNFPIPRNAGLFPEPPMTTDPTPSCPYCGCVPHANIGQCPAVKEIEYFPDGRVKRVVKQFDSEPTK